MEGPIIITGHKNPDSDSICSSIAYAELKRKLGIKAISGRLGEMNKETKFILDYFGVEPPEMIYTVKTQVSDLLIDPVIPVSNDISIKMAWNVMKRNNVKTLPVVDENEQLLGVVTLSDLTSKYMDAMDNNTIASSNTKLSNIVETLNANLLFGDEDIFLPSGRIVVTAMEPNENNSFIENGDIVITGDRRDNQINAIENGANCLILTCGSEPSTEVLEIAKERNCIILTTPIDTFTSARLINQSIPIKHIMSTGEMIKFNLDDYIDDVRERMLKSRFRSYPVVDNKGRVVGLISRYHLISHRKKKVILLDHNEKTQTVDGIEEAQILEIIDHHRLGDIQTATPVMFKNEPVGSTCTIVANIYFETGIKPSKAIAGVMCSAILSDTIKFASPTCTYTDRMTAEKLAEIANIDIDEFTSKMFRAGTMLDGKTPKEIIYNDFKEFHLGKYKIGIGQIFTIDFDTIDSLREDILECMRNLEKDRGFDLVILLITDILKHNSELMFVGTAEELVSMAFNMKTDNNSIFLNGVVSRKKQVVPLISSAIGRL